MRLTLVIIDFAAIGIQSAYAGRPRMDWDRAFIVGCKEAGNTEEVCVAFTDDQRVQNGNRNTCNVMLSICYRLISNLVLNLLY